MLLVLVGVYHVFRLTRACTLRSCVTREGFSFECKFAKTCVHSCAHTMHVILNLGTVCASIKFKSSDTVDQNVRFSVLFNKGACTALFKHLCTYSTFSGKHYYKGL